MDEIIGNSDEEEGNITLDANMIVVNEHNEVIAQLGSNDAQNHIPPLDHHFDLPDENSNDENADDLDSGNEEGYVIESDRDSDNEYEAIEASIPLVNYPRDVHCEQDLLDGWPEMPVDTGATVGPFMGQPRLSIGSANRDPITFFNALFDSNMWTILSEETNRYAHQTKLRTIGKYKFVCRIFYPILLDFVRFNIYYDYNHFLFRARYHRSYR